MTDKSAREIIAGAVLDVCSDGNSDNNRVASGILAALEAAGLVVVPVEPTDEMIDALRHPWHKTYPLEALTYWSNMLAASKEQK